FKYYKVYYPEDSLPKVVQFISGFNFQVPMFLNTLAIGMEYYLGRDFRYYPPDYPGYLTSRFDPAYIASDVIKAFLIYKTDSLKNTRRFIDEMLYEGKLLYLRKKLLPGVQDSILFGYTGQQL